MNNGLTPERRALKAALIQQWKPWEHSTGPRTAAGKRASAQRGDKGGMRGMMREMARFQREFDRPSFEDIFLDDMLEDLKNENGFA
ncbi:hypothetical protein CCP3SC1AL1_1420003 [Gammaproteobacteria bacterium]